MTIDELLADIRSFYTQYVLSGAAMLNPDRSSQNRQVHLLKRIRCATELSALFGQLDTRISTGEMPTDWKPKADDQAK